MALSNNSFKRCGAVLTGGYNKIFHRYEIINFLGRYRRLWENKIQTAVYAVYFY